MDRHCQRCRHGGNARFEVFNLCGTFQIILGKPWLSYVQAVHRYDTDWITFQTQGWETTISNDDDVQGEGHILGPTDTAETSM